MDFEQRYDKRFRIYLDESFKAEKEKNKSDHRWRYLELRGKYGYIYPFSVNEVAVAVTGPKIAAKVRRTQKWRVIQDSDEATVFLVPDAEINLAFPIIKPNRKKQLSDEKKAKLSEILKKAREAKQK